MEILARSIGRRKEAVATLKIVKGNGKFLINNKNASDYLHNNLLSIQAPLELFQKHSSNLENTDSNTESSTANLDILVKVEGGGLIGQAEAIKLAMARAICLLNPNSASDSLKKSFKQKGYLTQDARVKERRKYGLKKARKAPQYNKR
jgi:small subunit ribosomal protein S9